MPSEIDAADFVEADLPTRASAVAHHPVHMASHNSPPGKPLPTRQEMEQDINTNQARLNELRQQQEQIERERAALEEYRRRHTEFLNGRTEMSQHLTRGIGILADAEQKYRRDSEQMARTLVDLREKLAKVEALNEENWTQEIWNTELTRALTTLENARMEWNTALSRWPILSATPESPAGAPLSVRDEPSLFRSRSFLELCRLGFALTWPVAAVGFLILLVLILRK